jgi:hypothetical protein
MLLLTELPLSRELINMLATETQLNKVCDYVGKIVIPSDEEPMVIDDDGPNDDDLDAEAGMVIDNDGPNDDDLTALAGFDEETAEVRFNQETAIVELITAHR